MSSRSSRLEKAVSGGLEGLSDVVESHEARHGLAVLELAEERLGQAAA